MIFEKENSPRWIVFLFDIVLSFTALLIALFLRFNLTVPDEFIQQFKHAFPIVIGVKAICFLVGRTYAGIVRYTSFKDAERILIVNLVASLSLWIINVFWEKNLDDLYLLPTSVLIIDFMCTVFFMTALRLLVKTVYAEFTKDTRKKENVLIYGTQELAVITKRALELETEKSYKIIGFMDYSDKKIFKQLEGKSIFRLEEMREISKKYNVNTLVFAKANMIQANKNQIIQTCLDLGIKALTVPDVQSWINGELSIKQIKNIRIDDLLEREPIKLDKKEIEKQVFNQEILISGAAGSIGSEIVRQLAQYNPKKLILVDQAESPLYDLELELIEKFNFHKFHIMIGDITNKRRMQTVFNRFNPNIIYHAAAYKHVPMMENNPEEAIHNNFLGTKVLADLAVEHDVEKFVMISTDKAVNPTNVMGASKRISEIYTQSLNKVTKTNFITTRFGNVLGSNGSVIPRFRKQIETGGPVTVTHPEITRFFMTIPEACQLVLEASAMGRGGEIYIFDMGKPVKVADLAKNMVKLSGLKLGKDIQMIFTGLRPGEKLFEELLHQNENTLPTHHPLILIAKVKEYDYNEIQESMNHFTDMNVMQDKMKIVKLMKEFVPEYKSQNSIFEQLDTEKQN